MALYSQTIKNLVSGISQQPPILRFPEQLEFQENGLSTESSGLQKRPPSIHLAKIDPALLVNGVKPMVHVVNRDESEKYIMVFTGAGVAVWDNKGNQKTVSYEGTAKSYVTTSKPRTKLKAITVADHTFIVNTDVTVRMASDTVLNVWANQGALINIKSGQYGRTYSIIANGAVVASFTTPDGSAASHTTQIDTNYIATQLKTALTNNGFTVVQGESWLYFYKSGVPITSLQTKDGFNNNAMIGIMKTVQKFSNLPYQAPDGFVAKVVGESGSAADDYYVRYNATDGVWEETAEPGLLSTFDASTMPHILVRNADGTFTLKEATWDDRVTGDDDSNPIPSFVGGKLNDVFFFRNRLGLLSGENVILSKSGEFFDFWIGSAVELQDTDAVDLAVSSSSVSTLYHAVPFTDEVILLSDQRQFVLRADGTLTPSNVKLDPATEYGCSTHARPVVAGRKMYFPAERAEYTTVKEFYAVQDVYDIKDAQDVTSHVPSYIPNGVYKLIASTVENVLMFLTEGDEEKIFIYKYLFVEEQRIQASWSHWAFEGATILGGGFINSELYLLLMRDSGLFLEKIVFTYNTKDFDEEPYRVFLDRKTFTPVIPAENYDSVHNRTTIDIASCYGTTLSSGTYGIVTTTGVYKEFPVSEMTNGKVILPGNWTGQKVVVGQKFRWKITFSEIMLKTQGERGLTSDVEGRLQLKNFWVNYVNSGYFKVVVEQYDKETYSYEMTARILGSGKNTLGSMPSETGKFKFPVQSLSSNCAISVESSYPTPVTLIGAGWEGNYYRRTQRL